ncbi:uncharacterized protein CBL_04612 [Carabus blaptoides fortunei]
MVQVGCRLWNLSIVSVLVLTIYNVLLTVRLMHAPECILPQVTKSDTYQHTGVKDAHPPPFHKHPALPNLTLSAGKSVDEQPFQNLDLRLGRWDARHLIKMFDFALVGDKFPSLSEKYVVCLATQSSLEKLFSLVQVAHHWSGPISAAVYAAGDEELNLLMLYIVYLRKCHQAVRDRVSFHFAFPKEKLARSVRSVDLAELAAMNCFKPEAMVQQLLKKRPMSISKWRFKNPYPQNHLRNLARKNCQSGYVFLTDVDIIPSMRMCEGLDVFLRHVTCEGRCAYVIPTYELDERVRFPTNKSELVRLANKGLARPFHHKVFIYNQYATNISRWQSTVTDGPEVHISHRVTNFEFLYEPFYVALDTVPPHDERFLGYGFTRNTQVYEMFVADYEFHVLSPAFTCHWGLQQKRTRPLWRENQNSANRRHLELFKKEVFARYGKDPLHMVARASKDANKPKDKQTHS